MVRRISVTLIAWTNALAGDSLDSLPPSSLASGG